MRARRFETLHDTSLCKVLESTRSGSAQDSTSAGIACRLLQIDLQRWFRTGIRQLRESAPAESPCNYGYPERMVHSILCFVGGRGATEHAGGIPIWHDDQMHLAEWQALQQLDYLFNLTLAVDAKSMAIETLKMHKKGASAQAEARDMSEPTNKLPAADDSELHAVADFAPVLDEPLQDENTRGAVLPVTDKAALLRLLTREEEVAQARQLGQGRREALQCMKEAADVYGRPEHLRTHATDPSAFGASEHDKSTSLARHRDLLQKLREAAEKGPTCETESGDTMQTPSNEVGVELTRIEDTECASMGPVDFAKSMRQGNGYNRATRTGVVGGPRHANRI